HQLTMYHGNYDVYLAEREKQIARQWQAYEEQQEEIKTLQRLIKAKAFASKTTKEAIDNDKFLKHFRKEQSEKNKSREIQAAKQRLEEIEANPLPRPAKRWQINPEFKPEELISRDIIRLMNISKAYDGRDLFSNVTTTIHAGERVILQGPNGIGKS